MELAKNFSEAFNELFLKSDVSIAEFSKQVKISSSLISYYLRGLSVPSILNAVKIANFYSCTLSFLFGLSEVNYSKHFNQIDKSLFYTRLNNVLINKKITLYSLCKNLGVSKSNITRWKSGTLPKMETLVLISDFLGCSMDYLVGRIDT